MEQEFQFYSPTDIVEDELDTSDQERILKVRLDKWLWAARFFKTRAVARAAVEQGKVFYNGERSNPSREIEIGATVHIRQGQFEKIITVKGLSTRRRSTEEASQLFEAKEASEKLPLRKRNTESKNLNFTNQVSEQEERPRERRVVRFLRRSFNREDARPSSHTSTCFMHKETEIGD